jgi:hypothetical protein
MTINASCSTLNFAIDWSQIYTNGNTFLTTGASTTGSFYTNFNTYIGVGSPNWVIGNSGLSVYNNYSVFNGATTFTLANNQSSKGFFSLVESASSTGGLIYGDAKTGFGGSFYVQKQAFLQTTSESAQTLISLPVPSNAAVCMQGIISAQAGDYSDATGGDFSVFAQNVGGTLSIVGVPTYNRMSTGAGTIQFAISGTNLELQVLAPTTNAYNWGATYQFMNLLNSN